MPSRDWERAVRLQVERVLDSVTFRRAERLRRFLRFVTEETLAGRRDGLKESAVATHAFGRDPHFDSRSDPVVRVQARRLRARLARYYREEGRTDEVVIELPKGGYVPRFLKRKEEAANGPRAGHVAGRGRVVNVLLFDDYSEAGDLGYFCRGLREEIVHRLSSTAGLRVLVSDGDGHREHETGRPGAVEAGVIVDGGVRAASGITRVTARLVDGATGCCLWSAALDGPTADLFSIHERVAASVAEQFGQSSGALGAPADAPTRSGPVRGRRAGRSGPV